MGSPKWGGRGALVCGVGVGVLLVGRGCLGVVRYDLAYGMADGSVTGNGAFCWKGRIFDFPRSGPGGIGRGRDAPPS